MMKTILSTVLLWTAITMSTTQLHAQTARLNTPKARIKAKTLDTLHVLNQNILYAQVVVADIEKQKKPLNWQQLIENFKKNLRSIQGEIPEYLIYKIDYQNQQSLQVEEVEGVVKYQLNNDEMAMAYHQSVAHLVGEAVYINLYFNTIEDLLDINYQTMIEQGMQKITQKSELSKRIYFPPDNYYYSFSGAEILEDYLPKSKPEWIVITTPYLGVLKNKPLLELNTGMGIYWKRRKWNIVYFFINESYQYDTELAQHNLSSMMGLTYSKQDFGTLSVAVPVGNGNIYEDVVFRLTGGTFAFRNVSANIHLYFTKEGPIFPGLSVGIGW